MLPPVTLFLKTFNKINIRKKIVLLINENVEALRMLYSLGRLQDLTCRNKKEFKNGIVSRICGLTKSQSIC